MDIVKFMPIDFFCHFVLFPYFAISRTSHYKFKMMQEEVQKDVGAKIIQGKSNSIPSSPYSNLKREITEEDLKSPAVQRILLGEVDKLENRSLLLEDMLQQKDTKYDDLNTIYQTRDKEKAILDEKLKKSKSQEILYSFCLAAGSVIIGFAKAVWDKGLGEIFLGIGMFLIIGGIITKAVQWK